jgi:large subunit ribosomal protein L3
MQFWPRKRSRHSLARIRFWVKENKVKPLGFIAYKSGMTHIQVTDNRVKSLTKGEQIFMPVTIIECPPMILYGVAFYRKTPLGLIKTTSVLAPKLDKELAKQFQLPKKGTASLDAVKEFDDLRLLVHSNPKMTTIGTKKPKLLEVALGGNKDDKLRYVQENLGKEIKINDVFDRSNYVDVHGISTGKGFQGTVKRYGVPIRSHKAEKTKRGIATLGSWTPKRIEFNVPNTGKMGYHLRTEYNKQIIKVGQDAQEVTPDGGIKNYGVIRNPYLLLKGSVVGPRKRAIVMTPALRPDRKALKEAPEVTYIHK